MAKWRHFLWPQWLLGQRKSGHAPKRRGRKTFSPGSQHFRPQLEPLEDRTAPATFLVKDIRPGAALGSDPKQLVNVNGTVFFVANDGVTGFELWKSDGTSTGTQLVRDIRPGPLGSNPSHLINVNGTLYFVADDGSTGRELWRSDGTAAGTQRVIDLVPGPGSPFQVGFSLFDPWLTNVNGTVFFVANAAGVGVELWKTNGTAAGTVLVRDINVGIGNAFDIPSFLGAVPASLTNVNGTLYFVASDGPGGVGFELWKSDGTSAGTQLVRDIHPGGNSAFGISNTTLLTNVNGTLFFVADNGATGHELWKSDGTFAGTQLVRDINPGAASAFGFFSAFPVFRFADVGGILFFAADNGSDGVELWKSNGTSAGTVLVRDIYPGSFFGINSSNPHQLTNVNGTLFFAATSASGTELWKSDGTSAGTVLVKDIRPGGSSDPNYLTNVAGILFFAADDGTNGVELWRSDGSSAGTQLAADIRLAGGSSFPKYLTNVSGRLFFQANDGSQGTELWAHVEPANIVQVIPPGPGLYRAGDTLNFSVQFSKEVLVIGSPRLSLTIGAATRYAYYIAGSGSSTLLFRYVVQLGDVDTDGISVASPIDLNGGSIRDASNEPANLSFTPPDTSAVLVDGLQPFISSISLPANGTYTTGQLLQFQLQWNEAVNVDTSGGIPRLRLVFGNGDRFADYDSGSGTDTLTFQYIVQAGDFDFDGLALTSPLDLNGATITSAADSDSAFLSFTPPDTSGILIDALPGPAIAQVVPPSAGIYMTGMDLDFVLRFSRNVIVNTTAGTPRLPVVIGSVTRYAVYQSGSGSNQLLFRYTVVASDMDLDGIVMLSPVDLNGGTIRDSSGNDALLSFTPPDTSGVLVNPGPRVVEVIAPSPGTYLPGDFLEFQMRFDRSVVAHTAFGVPRLRLDIGGQTRFASYYARPDIDRLAFRYRVAADDLDTDGLEIVPPLDLNGGSIRDSDNRDALTAFTPPDTSGVLVGLPAPSVVTVSPPPVGIYRWNQVMDFSVRFSQTVWVDTAGGTPGLRLDLGGVSRFAPYFSGSGSDTLVFRYIVQSGDLETIGVGISPTIQLNGGSIRNVIGKLATLGFAPPNTAGVLVDAVPPTILAITPPGDGTYLAGQNLDFAVQFSEPVFVGTAGTMPALALVIGSNTRLASYVSGSGSPLLTFRYTVQPDDLDTNGIVLTSPIQLGAASIRDSAQNDALLSFSPPNTTGILVGVPPVVPPTIVQVSAPSPGRYRPGQQLHFVVQFSENVFVTGTPRLTLTLGSSTRFAHYVAGHGSPNLRFSYTVQVGDLDSDGISVQPTVDLNGGTIQNGTGTPASLNFTPPDTSGVLVDGVAPSVVNLIPPSSGTYRAGQALIVIVEFSEPVQVGISGSARPYLRLQIGGRTRQAVLAGSSGPNRLIFRYEVQPGDLDTDGITILSPIVRPAGTSIRDLAGINANTTFTTPSTPDVRVDAVAPRVVAILPPAPGTYMTGQTLEFLVRFSEPVVVTTSGSNRPLLRLRIGSQVRQASFVSQVNPTTLRFRYVVQASDFDNDGIEILSPLAWPPGSSIRDTAGNQALPNFVPPSTRSIRINVPPGFFPFV